MLPSNQGQNRSEASRGARCSLVVAWFFLKSPLMRIKICGITSETDAEQAARLGADAIGLNFYPPSPRSLTPERAAAMVRALPPLVEPVGLFVNESRAEIARVADVLRLRTVQIHRDAWTEWGPASLRCLAAFPVRDRHSLALIGSCLAQARQENALPAAILVDAQVAGVYGGSGQRLPWELLVGFDPGVPLILAGGLTPDNVAEAIGIVRPYAVDVASGVESSPGQKDIEKMRRFIGNAREAAARLAV